MVDHKPITLNKKLGLLLVAALSICFGNALADSDQEYSVRAALAVNFARFTTWPENSLIPTNKNFTLCLVGNPVLEDAFATLNGKNIGDRFLQVRYLTRFNHLNECQLLYISDLDNNKLLSLLNEIKALPILTLGEDDFFVTHGGMVSLQIVDGKVGMTINLNAAKRSNLSISARVLKLAKIIQ
ncbi:MAG: YfiR family protein [Methylococcales bacterium]